MNQPTDQEKKTWTEEIELAGSDLVETVKKLIQEGNVRRLIVKKPDGDVLIEVPLTAGVAISGVMVVLAPVLAALGALAALVARVTVVVVREEDKSDEA